MDEDLEKLDQVALLLTAKKMREAIRNHRDCSGHNLCWFHPEMWCLLPESPEGPPSVPAWPEFLHNCAAFRGTLDRPEAKQVDHTMVEAKIESVDYAAGTCMLKYTESDGGVKLNLYDFPHGVSDADIGKPFKLFKAIVWK